MKRKSVWIVVSCLMAVMLALLVQATEGEAGAKKDPQYGGTLVTAPYYKVGHFDPRVSEPWRQWTDDLVYNRLINLDFSRGPSGTGQVSFAAPVGEPGDFMGTIAEKWEQPDLNTVVVKIRKGIRWQNKPPLNGRELTAEDVAASLIKAQEFERFSYYYQAGIKLTATDEQTVKITFPKPSYKWLETISRFWVIYPVESVEKYGSLDDWKNACGTGPFIIKDWIPDSAMRLVRNPDYFQHDPLHPENQLPYVDEVKLLIIEDASTRMAALQTGKVAHQRAVNWQEAKNMIARYPDIQRRNILETAGNRILMRTDFQPFQKEKVRRALYMAIDFKSIVDKYYGGNAEMFAYPLRPDAGFYVPLKDYPESVQELFSYNPEKAKKLLAEAGYPNGFKVKAGAVVDYVELMSILDAYWSQIGVRMELDMLEQVQWQAMTRAHTHPPVTFCWSGNYPDPFGGFSPYQKGAGNNFGDIVAPYIDETFDKAQGTLDKTEREKLIKDMVLFIMDKHYEIWLPQGMIYNMWWPWLKQYDGVMDIYYMTWPRYAWIDKDLKKSMGH